MTDAVSFWQHVSAIHVLALAAGVAACRRSLLPRSLAGQVIAVTGAMVVTAAAVAGVRLVLGMSGSADSVRERLIWCAAAAAGAGLLSLPWLSGQVTGFVRTLLLLVAMTTLVDAALAAMWHSVPAVRRQFGDTVAHLYPQTVLALAAAAAAAAFMVSLFHQREFADEAGAAKLNLGAFLIGPLAGCAALGYVYLLLWIAREWVMRGRDELSYPVAVVIVLAVLGVLSGVVVLGVVLAFRWYQRKLDEMRDPGITEPLVPGPYLGGWVEAAELASLGPGGRQFLHGRLTSDRITAVTGRKAAEPIRIYVGRRSRPGTRRWPPQARVERVVEELDRTNAKERKYLIIAAPTGSGGIDQSAIDAFEYLTDGACATVVVQYAALPSVVALLLRQTGRKTYRLLYQAMAKRQSSQIILYGESLGALVSQNGLRDGSLASARALWVGTPRLAGPPAENTEKFTSGNLATDRPGSAANRYYLLAHADDPVTWLDLGILVRRPAQPGLRWLPIVTFCQLIADTLSALRPASGGNAGRGHDYRPDVAPLASLLLTAAGGGPPATGLVSRVAETIKDLDLTRVDGPVHDSGAAGGWQPRPITELRVHGVGGESPERTLNYPLYHQVAGDSLAGFYRAGTNEVPVADPVVGRREAYNWGGLVDGFWQRVLWVLLLPFALLNVATWMVPPDLRGHRGRSRSRLRTAIAGVLRVQGLFMTFALIVTLWGAGGYLAGWACPADDTCGAAPGSFGDTLAVPGLFTLHVSLPVAAGWRAVVSAIPAVVVLLVLFLIGRATRIRFENWPTIYPERPTPYQTGQVVPTPPGSLADHRFWRGTVAVARLQVIHLAGGLAVCTCLLSYPAYRAHTPGTGWLLGAAGALLLAAIAATAPHRWVGRIRSDGSGARADGRVELTLQTLLALSVALLATATVTVADRWTGPAACRADCARTSLPGFASAFDWAVWAQILLVTGIVVLLVSGRVWRRQPYVPDGYRPVQHGFVCATTAGVASLVGVVLGTGLLLVAARAGTIGTGDGVPAGVRNAAVVGAVALLAGFGAVVVLTVGKGFAAALARPAVIADYGRGGPSGAPVLAREDGETVAIGRRRGQIAGRWASGWRVDNAANAALGVLLIVVAAVATVRLWGADEPTSPLGDLRHWSVRLIAVLSLALISFAYGAVRVGHRSPVATLFDVTTVWPRAAHPFAPPCYAERAVPELVNRIEALLAPSPGTTTGCPPTRLVLVGYSQGSVLTVAALEQLAPYLKPGQIGLVTCGSPLRRLYARYYPTYFTPELLAAHAGENHGTLHGLKQAGLWRNVYRPSDPVGSWMHDDVLAGTREQADGTIDRRLLDPAGFGPPPGDVALPRIYGHGGYFTDIGLTHHIDKVAGRLISLQPASEPDAVPDEPARPAAGRRLLGAFHRVRAALGSDGGRGMLG